MIKSMWVRLRLCVGCVQIDSELFWSMVHDIMLDKTYVNYNQSLLFIIIHRFYCINTAGRVPKYNHRNVHSCHNHTILQL